MTYFIGLAFAIAIMGIGIGVMARSNCIAPPTHFVACNGPDGKAFICGVWSK